MNNTIMCNRFRSILDLRIPLVLYDARGRCDGLEVNSNSKIVHSRSFMTSGGFQ